MPNGSDAPGKVEPPLPLITGLGALPSPVPMKGSTKRASPPPGLVGTGGGSTPPPPEPPDPAGPLLPHPSKSATTAATGSERDIMAPNVSREGCCGPSADTAESRASHDAPQ